MATIKQIAERCEVSPSTVSKALNGAEDVSRSTIIRIRKVAEEMGYTPNAAARALKTSHSYCFGLLVADSVAGDMPNEFFSRIIVSFKRRSSELGYDLTSINNHIGKRRIDYAEHARYRNLDGILVVAGNESDNLIIPKLVETGIPVVCIDYGIPGCGSICSDNEQGMRDLVNYVIEQGHRRIAYIYGHDTLVTRTRIESFRATCAVHGIEVPPAYLVPSLYHVPARSEAATRQLLSLPVPPSCILYPDDLSYIGGMNEMERRGGTMPLNISTAAYDGLGFSQAFHPKLTTIRQNSEAMGSCAAEELVRAIEAGANYDHRRILIPGELLHGETVRPFEE
ncbi:MAG: LacI family DNA-binding transcriptional regulator [Oscillospiraceae bacterium]|nr:LacI family DNA-binding transcriptional regulator [Oscillospiraceae bacterium]